MSGKHPAILHWRDAEDTDPGDFAGTSEPMSFGAALGERLGLKTIGIHHMRLLPGRRTSLPHAESHEEEFVYVIAGAPDVWLDGVLYRLRPGDAVGFPSGTGLAHSFLNNTETEVQLLVVGNSDMEENRIVYPVNPERIEWRTDWWHDAPKRALGSHDGMTDKRRAEVASGLSKKPKS
jgi:uncharacterized cupin superfamily protein